MSTYDPNDPMSPSDDDFLTRGEARQLHAQAQAADAIKAALERAYYDVVPEHRGVQGEVARAFTDYVYAHPEKQPDLYREAVSGQVGPALSEAYFATRDTVNGRLTAAPAGAGSEASVDWRRYELSDDERQAAIREDVERYEKTRRP